MLRGVQHTGQRSVDVRTRRVCACRLFESRTAVGARLATRIWLRNACQACRKCRRGANCDMRVTRKITRDRPRRSRRLALPCIAARGRRQRSSARKDAERFIEEVRGDDRELARNPRIEERRARGRRADQGRRLRSGSLIFVRPVTLPSSSGSGPSYCSSSGSFSSPVSMVSSSGVRASDMRYLVPSLRRSETRCAQLERELHRLSTAWRRQDFGLRFSGVSRG